MFRPTIRHATRRVSDGIASLSNVSLYRMAIVITLTCLSLSIPKAQALANFMN